jgi:hypothetical protein
MLQSYRVQVGREISSNDFQKSNLESQNPSIGKRHEHNIRSKIEERFSVTGPELHDRTINPVNVYNMDETEVMLSGPCSVKVLLGKDYSGTRGVRANRESHHSH